MSSLAELLTKRLHLPFDKSPKVPPIKSFFVSSTQLPKKHKFLLIAIIICGFLSVTTGLVLASNKFLSVVPQKGGKISEGLVGTPRFINPLLATSDVDRDLVALVYSGLMRAGKYEHFEPDLAESYSISDDGKIYTFKLRNGLYWHDGSPVSAKDVVFTILMAKDDRVKSPKRGIWDGVRAEAVDDQTVKIIIKNSYSPFLENTTMGILPEHLWGNVRPEEFALHALNLRPVGTGPYKIKAVQNNSSGVPVSVNLSAFKEFALGAPNINEVLLKFYDAEEDLIADWRKDKSMAISGISTDTYGELKDEGFEIKTFELPRIFGIFFNQNSLATLADKAIREALAGTVPRDNIVMIAMGGLAKATRSPLPQSDTPQGKIDSNIILDKAGWQKGTDGVRVKKGMKLHLEISTSDSPELKKVAAIVSESWRMLGVETVVKVYEPSDLNVNIIRPRKFEALLFGESLGHYPDPYAFWHSSQRLDPGLNIAQYTNSKADAALEEIRTSTEYLKHKRASEAFLNEIANDVPGVFLYSPMFAYLPTEGVKGLDIPFLGGPADRFNQVYKWYLETEKVWSIFINNKI